MRERTEILKCRMANIPFHIMYQIRKSKSVKCLKLGKGFVTIAVCAGSKEIYKKIKQRDRAKSQVGIQF